MNTSFDLLINSFLENNLGIDTAFLSEELAQGLQFHLLQLQSDKLMHVAGIGNDTLKDSTQKMRSDKIYWLDKKHNNLFENQFLLLIEEFIEHLNRTCYTGINNYEFHYAIYEPGSSYKRHKDQFKNNDHRKFSLITYLNDNWQENDGGQLLLYTDNNIQAILPQAQTAVFFKSDETEHEVMPANRSRMSITGWLKRI